MYRKGDYVRKKSNDIKGIVRVIDGLQYSLYIGNDSYVLADINELELISKGCEVCIKSFGCNECHKKKEKRA